MWPACRPSTFPDALTFPGTWVFTQNMPARHQPPQGPQNRFSQLKQHRVLTPCPSWESRMHSQGQIKSRSHIHVGATTFSDNPKEKNIILWCGFFFPPPNKRIRQANPEEPVRTYMTRRSCLWASFSYGLLRLFLFIFTELWRKPNRFLNLKQMLLTATPCSVTFLLVLPSKRKKTPVLPRPWASTLSSENNIKSRSFWVLKALMEDSSRRLSLGSMKATSGLWVGCSQENHWTEAGLSLWPHDPARPCSQGPSAEE